MARYKLNSDGSVYYDQNDTGPDQASPDQIQQYQASQQAPAPPPDTQTVSAPSSPIPNSGVSGYGDAGGATGTPVPAPAPTSTPMPNQFGDVRDQSAPQAGYAPSGWTGITDPGSAYSKGASNFWNLYQNYWAPDRDAVLAAARMGGADDAGASLGGIKLNSPTTTTTSTQPLVGWDATKWNDPTKHDPKYDVGHILANFTPTPAGLQQAAPQLAQLGYRVTGKDQITGPDGTVYDVGVGFSAAAANGTPGSWQWSPISGPGGAPLPQTGGATGTIGTSGIGGSVSPLATGGAPQNSAFSDQVRQLLLQQLGGLQGPVTGNDPQIKAEMDAQDAALTRNQRQQRAAAAERMAMNGLLNGGQSSGAFDQELNSEFENKGQQLTGLQAQLFTQEIQRRSQQANQLLQMALASGDAESARQLQAYLAQLDNAYRYAALQQNQGQFNDTFGLNAAQFEYNKNRDLATYGAGY